MADQITDIPAWRIFVLRFEVGHDPDKLYNLLVCINTNTTLDGNIAVEVTESRFIKRDTRKSIRFKVFIDYGTKLFFDKFTEAIYIFLAVDDELHEVCRIVFVVEVEQLLANIRHIQKSQIAGRELSERTLLDSATLPELILAETIVKNAIGKLTVHC